MDERPVVKGQRRTSTYGSRAQWNSLTSGIIFEPNVQPKASVTGLSPDKQYTFRVCAINKAGKGPFSPPSESCLPLMKRKLFNKILIYLVSYQNFYRQSQVFQRLLGYLSKYVYNSDAKYTLLVTDFSGVNDKEYLTCQFGYIF